jgi:hypothetical protein
MLLLHLASSMTRRTLLHNALLEFTLMLHGILLLLLLTWFLPLLLLLITPLPHLLLFLLLPLLLQGCLWLCRVQHVLQCMCEVQWLRHHHNLTAALSSSSIKRHL